MARARKRIDPELQAQLAAAAGRGAAAPRQAVIQLRPEAGDTVVPGPERTHAIARSVLARVTRKLGREPRAFHVFPHLGTFVVSASTEFLRELLDQPEVQGALANRPGDAGRGASPRRSSSTRRPGPR